MSLDRHTAAWVRSLSDSLQVTPSRAAADIIRIVRDIAIRQQPQHPDASTITPEDEIRMMFEEYSTTPLPPRHSTEVRTPLP